MGRSRSRKLRWGVRKTRRGYYAKQKGGAKKRDEVKKGSKLFTDAYALTVRSVMPRRFEKLSGLAAAAGVPLQAWDGPLLKKEDIHALPPLGVGTTHFKDRTGAVFNLGVIGAFLGHRTLLDHIHKTGAGKPGTFICEDDIAIPPDFYEKLAALEEEIETHAPDWDILFLDKHPQTIDGDQISTRLIKLKPDLTGNKNWGIWSYIVKNSSVGPKILPTMKHMLDVPDLQLARFADHINMYLITPSIVQGDPETALNSAVTKKDSFQI